MEKYRKEWNQFLKSIKARSMPWGTSGGTQYIQYKQTGDNDFSVRIFLNGEYDKFKQQHDAVVHFFEDHGCVLLKEDDVKEVSFGYYKQLDFVDSEKAAAMEKEAASPVSIIHTQINGDVNNSGGAFNTGNAETINNSASSQSEDKKWFQKEVVKCILSFIGGVAATVVGQWLLHYLGIIQ